jgi:NADPH-dependent FMN reductase
MPDEPDPPRPINPTELEPSMITIAAVLASTRPGRRGDAVAQWVLEHASQREDAAFELLDLAAVDLPPIDEPMPPVCRSKIRLRGLSWG